MHQSAWSCAFMTVSATFAIPGDIDTPTGGYIYEKQLLLALRRIGVTVAHLQLPGGFPDATQQDEAEAANALAALSPDQPVILDGFLPGCLPPEQLSQMRAPYVAVTHHPLCYETGIDPQRAQYLRAVESENLKRAAHVIVPSPHTGEMLIEDFGVPRARVTVAPPGVQRPRVRPAAVQNSTEILCVGQLVPRKGHEIFLSALATLGDLDWTATIIGRESDAAYGTFLRELAVKKGIAERVRFSGHVTQDRLAEYYARASVFALATRYEGYGMVFAEAMLHGLPIVTCGGGAVPDTVPDDAGVIVPVDDVAGFAAGLRRLLSDDTLRRDMAQASARHGRALPTWEATAGIVKSILEQVVA